MLRPVRCAILLVSAAILVLLAGCGTFSFAPGPGSAAPRYANGQVVDITGRVALDKNQVLLQDLNSNAVFRFVGLQPAAQKALAGLVGKNTRVRLKVISFQPPQSYNAQFVQFSTR